MAFRAATNPLSVVLAGVKSMREAGEHEHRSLSSSPGSSFDLSFCICKMGDNYSIYFTEFLGEISVYST